jgi:enoyl-CoA hydratase/carnithine racemase
VQQSFQDVRVETNDHHVALVEIRRAPNNFMDPALIRSLADACEAVDADPASRVIVLASEGKHFCAGVDLGSQGGDDTTPADLYAQAARLLRVTTPVVAAVQGAAIGGGLGLACCADFRVASAESSFSANFAQLGFHHGFGLSVTLPAIVGRQNALDLLYTGRRVRGEEAFAMSLCDRLESPGQVRSSALLLAATIATSGPLALQEIRRTMWSDLADAFVEATRREAEAQRRLLRTADFREGVRASAQRRPAVFTFS